MYKRLIYINITLLFICLIYSFSLFAKNQLLDSLNKFNNRSPVRVEVKTTKGKFIIELSDLTPRHRDNFIRNVQKGDYNGLIFHRVIEQFMIQTGNMCTKNCTKDQDVSIDTLGSVLDAEFCDSLIHRRYAVAAARESDDINPKMQSSDHQFYIVTGKFFTDHDLDKLEKKYNHRYKEWERKAYKLEGGTPHLDRKYTVFAYVVKGQQVIDKIESQAVGGFNRPIKDIYIISMRILP